jgi:hypothetical protein
VNTGERTRALLALVDEYRDSKCAELLGAARADARALVREAVRRARARVHEAIAEERKRYATALGAAEAQLHTRRRLAHQGREAGMIAAAWRSLPAALRDRWREPERRGRWLRGHLERALASMPREPWEVRHAPGPADAEMRELAAWLAGRGGPAASFVEDASIAAGFRVRAGHNTLDATLDGLAADRKAIEGRLLHHLEQGEEPAQ